ncbi:hypothetical protein [Gemmobacter nectariphilus]|uniref:hypothetical protein n=1 Tax=Gemmobacter nectariphilus TaxID=220343 RepID=UPI00040DB3AF|nr:hypothetical protein [Gemmobacter nectariphilus]
MADAIAALHEVDAPCPQLLPPEQVPSSSRWRGASWVSNAGPDLDSRREGGAGIIRAMVAPRQMEAAEGQNHLSADGTKAVFRRHPGDPTITGKRFAPRSGRMLRMATND